MNSGEPLQGAPALGLDPAAGSAQVENAPALTRRIHEKAFAPSRSLRFVYWAYERWLLRQLQQGPLPRHVGIILDGNRWDVIGAEHCGQRHTRRTNRPDA